MDEPDPRTIRAAAAGDVDAFTELVHRYQGPVQRFLRELLGDAATAEDVTQEAFIRVHQRLDAFRFQCKFSTWLFQIARNAGVDALRRRARRVAVEASVPRPAVSRDPVERAELRAAIASLRPRLREALLVVEVLGLSYRESAEVLGVPEGTVKSRVFTARNELTAWLTIDDSDTSSNPGVADAQ